MHQPADPDFRANITEKVNNQPFLQFMGIELVSVEAGKFTCRLDLKKHHQQNKGYAHGGVVATMADIAAGFAAATLVKKGQHIVTVELKISFLNPVVSPEIIAVGTVLKAGRKLFFTEAEIYVAEGRKMVLAGKASATMAVINPEQVKRKTGTEE